MLRSYSKTLVTLLGVGIFGLTGAAFARAQANGTSAPMTSEQAADLPDPAPINFPIAAPGAQDLMHYRSYNAVDIVPGSVQDARDEIEKAKDQKFLQWLGGVPLKEDEAMIDPGPINFPIAAPGAQDLLHYYSYRSITIVPGSVEDAREEIEKKKDQRFMQSLGGVPLKEDEAMIDPAPINFPIAAPGAQDLMHYRSYNAVDIVPGSVEDARDEIEKAKDRKAMQGMKDAPSSK